MTETDDLVERLRRRASDRRVGVPNVDLRVKPTTTLLIEAADTIASLTRKLEEAREAMAPFFNLVGTSVDCGFILTRASLGQSSDLDVSDFARLDAAVIALDNDLSRDSQGSGDAQ